MDGKITEVEFADMLLTYSSFTSKKKERTLKRIKKTFSENSQVNVCILIGFPLW